MIVPRPIALAIAGVLSLASLGSSTWADVLPEDAAADSAVAWAYGTIVDSITVTGNAYTKDYVLLREMETRAGDVLDESILRRDIRLLNDLSPFSLVEVQADRLANGHTALRLLVTERNRWLMTTVLPTLKYDFEEGITYGIRARSENFRGRLEDLSFNYQRNQRDDDDVSFGWSAPWIGWKHLSVGVRASYFNRGRLPPETTVLERLGVAGFVGLPLTNSRIRFSQLTAALSVDKTRQGGPGLETIKELTLSPSLGHRFDSRDSRLRPETGWTVFNGVGASYPLEGARDTWYRYQNELRHFRRFSDRGVLALLSNLFYQFGDFPDFSTIPLGGAGSLRGQPESRFSGFHRWYGTVEWRYQFLPRQVIRTPLPLFRQFDVGLAFISFIDSGIVWNGSEDFGWDKLHGTGGVGLRFYNPVRDVLRFDFGTNLRGAARFHFGTGIRF